MSKLILYDFLCPTHGLFEELVKSRKHSIPCPTCKANARRQISAVRIDRTAMATQEGATPTSIDHFERIHKERRAIEERHHKEHGDYGPEAGSDGGRGYPVVHDDDAILL